MEKSTDKWTNSEVQVLLSLFAMKEVQRDFESSNRNTKIFASISTQLASLGIHHTAKQCREKIKKLKQDYRKIKNHNNRSGSERKTSKWYDMLDSILGHRPAYAGNADTKDTAAGLLEDFACGTGSCSPPTEDDMKDAAPESLLGDESVASDAPVACSSPSPTSSAPPVRPGKRKRRDSSVLSLVKEMLESDEEDRRQTQDQMQSLLQMVREQSQRETEELQQLRAEAAETRRQQTAFLGGLLNCLNQLVTGLQVPSHPEID